MKHGSVLIVEDDQTLRRLLCRAFEESGFEVRGVGSGGEALGILETAPPRGVVLDLQLSDRMGGRVLDRLREMRDVEGVRPVWVVISVLDEGEAVARYGPLAGPFLAKPFNPWELVRLLRGLVTGWNR